MVAKPRAATYRDLEALAPNVVGELIGGVLHANPRPASLHAAATSALGEELGPPFKRGRGGPGGWVILDEPELHIGDDVLVPDIAGWRRERMPQMPEVAFFTLAPDWLSEVLSPSTAGVDRAEKLPVYARAGVRHIWLVDPVAKTLEILRLGDDRYVLLTTFHGDAVVRAEPFDAIELELGILWAR